MIIKHDLTDERVLYCRNGQLSLIITINCRLQSIYEGSFSPPSWCCGVCTFTQVYTDVIDVFYFTPPQHPPRFSALKTPSAPHPPLTPVFQNGSRFTVTFTYQLVPECWWVIMTGSWSWNGKCFSGNFNGISRIVNEIQLKLLFVGICNNGWSYCIWYKLKTISRKVVF